MRGQRKVVRMLTAAFERRHWRALFRSFTIYLRPIDGLRRFIFLTGAYPTKFLLRTPIGTIQPELHHPHDMRTINEIFARVDYDVPNDIRTVVDFGSNIGISALWFLTRNSQVRVWCYEPLEQNLARLCANVADFGDRVEIAAVAVGLEDGEVSFGVEETGRYGGIGIDHHKGTVTVPCRDANAVIAEVLATSDRIDVLKVDIESLEREIIGRIPADMLARIDCILIEQRFEQSPLPDFELDQYGYVARLRRRGAAG